MKSITPRKSGAFAVIAVALTYCAYRVITLASDFSVLSACAAVIEISAICLAATETCLITARGTRRVRHQDANVLLESAKSVLFSQSSEAVASQAAGGSTKVAAQQATTTGSFAAEPVDVVVYAEDATTEQLRRCFLSLSLLKDIDHVYVIDTTNSEIRDELVEEFGYHTFSSMESIAATTSSVLMCRGTDILYPDACEIARTYESDDKTFLELRSVYSDERALGENGTIEINDKRQLVREALATHALSTWSTGPAVVPSSAVALGAEAKTAQAFFATCERNGIHGTITEEVVSEEISHEQTISEVEWRALDLAYTTRAWSFSYKNSGSQLLSWTIKAWSTLTNIAIVRRVATVAFVLAFVVSPSSFDFVTKTYLGVGVAAAVALIAAGYWAGDRRSISSRVREFYFDVEASAYRIYKSGIKPESRASDKSLVKKLPLVSTLLVAADLTLVYRVWVQQSRDSFTFGLDTVLKNSSLFAGYVLIVSMLVGLGMVIVRQTRSAIRREISRGANLNSEPVSMIDLSPGGAGCISVTSYDIDSYIEFESSLPVGDDNAKFQCSAVVRSCVAWNDSYRVGIEFKEITQDQKDILETYCSIVYPHSQAREILGDEQVRSIKSSKLNGVAEKRFLSYAASFVALGAIIYSNLSTFR